MSDPQTQPRQVNRIPQFLLLGSVAAIIIFLVLLGTDTIALDGPPVMMIASGLFGIAMVATALEFGLNQTGIDKKQKSTNPDS